MSIRELFPINKWDFNTKSILEDLPAADMNLLTAHKTEQYYAKGEIVFL